MVTGPFTWYVVDPMLRRNQSVHLPFIIVAPFALLNFLLYALGRILCVVLAICLVAVCILPEVSWQTKLVTTIAGVFTSSLIWHWVTVVKHTW